MADTYETIKTLAKNKHIKISDIEKRAGLSRGTMRKWRNHSPNATNLKAVADVLKVKMEKLI